MDSRVGVGVAVFVLSKKNKNFIIGKRKGSHGAGTWALPGGHLDYGESFETCAEREVHEETGLNVQSVRFLTATNDVMEKDSKHYVTIFMVGEVGERDEMPRVMEPEKCERWEWVSWDTMKAWALAQMAELESGHDSGLVTGQLSSAEKEGSHENSMLEERLFSPLLALIEQRPQQNPTLS